MELKELYPAVSAVSVIFTIVSGLIVSYYKNKKVTSDLIVEQEKKDILMQERQKVANNRIRDLEIADEKLRLEFKNDIKDLRLNNAKLIGSTQKMVNEIKPEVKTMNDMIVRLKTLYKVERYEKNK